jgi:hypothetical protein
MLKKLVKTAIFGCTIIGLAASANAADININIYGASAQFKFWSAAAGDFLEDQGCAPADVYSASDDDKHGITMCAGTEEGGSGINGDNNNYYIRYSSKASYDGIRSVQGIDVEGLSTGCPDEGYRQMADETAVTWTAGGGADTGLDPATDLTCKDVTIGASDVAAETFGQSSSGALKGPNGGDPTDRDIYNLTVDAGNYNSFRPIVVPFAFFRNANAGTPVPFDNMSRLMATAIFSGQASDWNQFDPTLASLPIVVCLRHAGSGTHATLDAAVLRGDYPLLTQEITGIPGLPTVYFNDGSSDEMRCVGGGTISGYDGIGAVGYADADKVIMDGGTGEYHDPTKYGDIKLMTWMGEEAVKENIINGKYDFWSAQWLYASKSEDTAVLDMIDDLVAFASDPANLPSSKADYWSAQDEMMVEKVTDFTYPKFK